VSRAMFIQSLHCLSGPSLPPSFHPRSLVSDFSLLYLLRFERVANLGAYRIPRRRPAFPPHLVSPFGLGRFSEHSTAEGVVMLPPWDAQAG
jgi:hypothetical protein